MVMGSGDKAEATANLWRCGKFSMTCRAHEQTFAYNIFSLPRKIVFQLNLSFRIFQRFQFIKLSLNFVKMSTKIFPPKHIRNKLIGLVQHRKMSYHSTTNHDAKFCVRTKIRAEHTKRRQSVNELIRTIKTPELIRSESSYPFIKKILIKYLVLTQSCLTITKNFFPLVSLFTH